MVIGLRKAATFAVAIAAFAALFAAAALALSYRDVDGRWCTGAGETEFTPQYLKILRYSDSETFSFPITRYGFSDTQVTVYWRRQDATETTTIYGRFSSDGMTMVQLPTTAGERPHPRC